MDENHLIAVDVPTPGGLRLAGLLRVPEAPTPLPGLVFTGPFTGVKEQVVSVYAEELTSRGYVTLVFDHRNFGASEGSPRQHEDSGGKLEDLAAAVTFLAARPEVDPDRIGCVGVCLGAGYALKFTAFDPRVRALATVAGAYNDPREMRRGMGADGYRETLRSLVAAGVETMAAVAAGGGPAAMPGQEPFDYYGTDRGAVPGWRNEVTRASITQLLTFDAAIGADFVAPTPVRIVHGTRDDFCSPEGAQAVHDRVAGPRDLVWIETTNHIDLYDQPAYVEQAVEACADWFDRHLVG